MRIGIDARWIFPEITGIGSYTQELIRHLARVDTKNEYVLFFCHTEVLERTHAYADLGAASNVTSVQVTGGPFSLGNQFWMPGLIRQQRLDVFHSTNFMIPFRAFPRRRRGRVACVITIHDLIPLLFPEHTPKALKSRFHPLYRAVMREVGARADWMITVSESSRRDIIEHMRIPPDRREQVVAIYEGVSERYAPAERPRADVKTILYVGRMDPYKNVPGLLTAFSRLLKRGEVKARLRIIGPRDARYPQAQQVIEREQLQSHVDWPGYVSGDELRTAYQTADVFVLPSLYEGFGLPVLEAMASGTPVICGNRASLPEVAGDAAVLIDPENIDQLTNALELVLGDTGKAEALRIRGLDRAAHFSWERTARETVTVYEKAQCALD